MSALPVPYRASSSTSRRHFLSIHHLQSAVVRCRHLRSICSTNMLQWGHLGWGGYLPPGSQLCPARGGGKSESGGWSGLTPHPGTPLPGTGSSMSVLGRRPSESGPPWGVGGSPPPGLPAPHHDVSDDSCIRELWPEKITPTAFIQQEPIRNEWTTYKKVNDWYS